MLKFELQFESDLDIVKDAVSYLLSFIHGEIPAISKEVLGDLKLIFFELIINAVLHGNGLDKDKQVTVSLSVTPDTFGFIVDARITDEGDGFSIEALEKTSGEGQLSENGRGVLLVKRLTDFIDVGVGCIHFQKKVFT